MIENETNNKRTQSKDIHHLLRICFTIHSLFIMEERRNIHVCCFNLYYDSYLQEILVDEEVERLSKVLEIRFPNSKKSFGFLGHKKS